MKLIVNRDMVSESSPELIPSFDFKMADPDRRKKFLDFLMRKPHREVGRFEDVLLYGTGLNNHKGYVFAQDGGDLAYFVKIVTLKLRGLPKVLKSSVQVAVWRNDQMTATANLSDYVFFKILLPKLGVMVSDGQQTERGKRFWLLRMVEALRSGMFVYAYNRFTHELIQLPDRVTLDARIKESYGSGATFRNLRFVISSTKLDLK